MSKYADVYLLPLPKKNLSRYKKLATAAGKIFKKHGAIRYREYVESDLKVEGPMPFPKAVTLKKDEVLIYATVTFKSESHRNQVMKKIFQDPDLGLMMTDKPLFDMRRMVYGGFRVMVEV